MRGSLALLLALPLLSQVPSPAEKERVLAEHYAARIRAQGRASENALASNYINRITGDLLSRALLQAKVELISSYEISEPVAVSPGYLFIPISFVGKVQDESELIGMLAHSIGHLAHTGPASFSQTGTIRLAPVYHALSASGSP